LRLFSSTIGVFPMADSMLITACLRKLCLTCLRQNQTDSGCLIDFTWIILYIEAKKVKPGLAAD